MKVDFPFYKRLASLAVPVIAQNFLQSFVNMLDTIMVGSMGQVSIAAAGLGNQVFFLLMLFLFGTSSGAGIFIAQYWGRKDIAGIRRTMGLALALALAASAVFTAAALAFPEGIIALYSADPAVIAAGGAYLRAAAPCYPALALSTVFAAALRSVEKAHIPLAASAAALAVNAAGNYALIFGAPPFIPALGIRGAGYATVISRTVECALLLALAYGRRTPAAGSFRAFAAFDRSFAARYAKIAAPVILNETLWSLGVTMQNAVFARAGTAAAAAFNIAGTVNQLTWVAFMGLGNAAAVIIGKAIGEGDEAAARRSAARCAVFMPLASCAAGALLLPLSALLGVFFKAEPAVIAEARRMLLVIICLYPLKTFNLCMIVGVQRAGGDTLYCAVTELSFMWLAALPAGAALAFIARAEPWVIFLGLASDEFLKSGACFLRLKSGKWLRNVAARETRQGGGAPAD